MTRYDHERIALESASGGKNTLLLDDKQKPSVMVRIPKFRICDVIKGSTDTSAHPAFIVGDKEVECIYISKYANVVREDRAYSLAGEDPAAYVTRDKAKQYCESKGKGWHLMSNAEYAAIALWCKANGFFPHGNNYCGCDHEHKWEKGIKSPGYEWPYDTNWNNMALYQGTDGRYYHIGRTLTGSGPATWFHDGTPYGVDGLNGGMWELTSGLRTLNGEIQVIPNNNSALGVDESTGSSEWRAILQNGTYATPGIAGTLKINGKAMGNDTQVSANKGVMLLDIVRENVAYTGGDVNDYWGYYYNTFESFTAASGITVPPIMHQLGLFPADTESHGADGLWCRNYGERIALRGGYWTYHSTAGVFALNLAEQPLWSGAPGGFRAAFVDLGSGY